MTYGKKLLKGTKDIYFDTAGKVKISTSDLIKRFLTYER